MQEASDIGKLVAGLSGLAVSSFAAIYVSEKAVPVVGGIIVDSMNKIRGYYRSRRINKAIKNSEPPFSDGQLYLPFKNFY
jgi:hypothetical protein